jgi:holin-like protein
MKYIKQFAIILLVSFLGEVLHALLPLPIPASIYGLVLMLGALMLGIVPLHAVRECGKFLIEIMPLMFIPAAVGLTQAWDRLAPILVKLVIITAVSTVLVMVVSGRVTQAVLRRTKQREAQK